MHRVMLILFCTALLIVGEAARGAEFKLTDGTVLIGEPVSPNAKGVIIKSEDKLSTRIEWVKFTPEGLKELQNDPKSKPFAELLLEPAPAPLEKSKIAAEKSVVAKKAAAVAIKSFVRPERPSESASIGAGLASPVGLVAVFLFLAAHAYAGLEIARYRNRPPALICGIAMIPILGPIIGLCFPTAPIKPVNDGVEAPPTKKHDLVLPSVAAEAARAEAHAHQVADQPPRTEAASPPKPSATVFTRGTTTFNRRFFETKLAGFMRLVPGDAEKKLEIAFITSRGEFVGRRVSKLEAESLLLAIQKGDTFYEEKIPYVEINEVQVRPREENSA